jgi:hypothetical protein
MPASNSNSNPDDTRLVRNWRVCRKCGWLALVTYHTFFFSPNQMTACRNRPTTPFRFMTLSLSHEAALHQGPPDLAQFAISRRKVGKGSPEDIPYSLSSRHLKIGFQLFILLFIMFGCASSPYGRYDHILPTLKSLTTCSMIRRFQKK